MRYGPTKEAVKHTQHVVVTSGLKARPGGQEVFDEHSIDSLLPFNIVLRQITVQKPQGHGFSLVLPIQGLLIKLTDKISKGSGHGTAEGEAAHSTSPSPIATSRRAAISNFVYISVVCGER